MNNIGNEDEEELDFGENAKFTRVYSYLPYSYWRIVEILNVYYNANLVCIRAYKEGRYPGYKQHYNISSNIDNALIFEHVYLDDLRHVFAHAGFQLHESDIKRNSGAENFIKILRDISSKQ